MLDAARERLLIQISYGFPISLAAEFQASMSGKDCKFVAVETAPEYYRFVIELIHGNSMPEKGQLISPKTKKYWQVGAVRLCGKRRCCCACTFNKNAGLPEERAEGEICFDGPDNSSGYRPGQKKRAWRVQKPTPFPDAHLRQQRLVCVQYEAFLCADELDERVQCKH